MKQNFKTMLLCIIAAALSLAVTSCNKEDDRKFQITNIIENNSSHKVEHNSMTGETFNLAPGEKTTIESNIIMLAGETTLEYLSTWSNPFSYYWTKDIIIDGKSYLTVDVDKADSNEIDIYILDNDPFLYKHWETVSFEEGKATFRLSITDEFVDSILNRE